MATKSTPNRAQVLTRSVATWPEVGDLIAEGFTAHPMLTGFAKTPNFNVVLKRGDEERVAVFIENDRVKPWVTQVESVLDKVVCNSDATSVRFRLVEKPETEAIVLYPRAPAPDIRWSSEKRQLKREAVNPTNKCVSLYFEAGYTDIEFGVTPPLKELFLNRQKRIALVLGVLEKKKLTFSGWCRDSGLIYATAYKVLRRGDNNPEVRTHLSKLVKKPVSTLFPEIDWEAKASN